MDQLENPGLSPLDTAAELLEKSAPSPNKLQTAKEKMGTVLSEVVKMKDVIGRGSERFARTLEDHLYDFLSKEQVVKVMAVILPIIHNQAIWDNLDDVVPFLTSLHR